MKKKTIIIIVAAVVLIAAIALGLVWYFVWNDSAYIGKDAAAAAALADSARARCSACAQALSVTTGWSTTKSALCRELRNTSTLSTPTPQPCCTWSARTPTTENGKIDERTSRPTGREVLARCQLCFQEKSCHRPPWARCISSVASIHSSALSRSG